MTSYHEILSDLSNDALTPRVKSMVGTWKPAGGGAVVVETKHDGPLGDGQHYRCLQEVDLPKPFEP